MLLIRLLLISLLLGVGISANETISRDQQAFLFGEMGLGPDVGALYRSKKQNQGYDIYANSIGTFYGTELAATYNFYAPTKIIQPYIGMGAGVALIDLDRDPNVLGVVPIVLGLNSKIFFTDIGVSAYLGPHSEQPPNPIVFIRPQVRAGLGFQF